MSEYFFLFGLALIWIVAAVYRDLKTTVVPNWLSFSLIVFALAYRAFYSIEYGISFFAFGLLGFVLFRNIGNLLYQSGGFGGADVRLLSGIGVVLPFESGRDLLFYGGGFIMLLFISGLAWSLIYSFFIVARRQKEFSKEIRRQFKKHWFWFVFILILLLVFFVIVGFDSLYLFLLLFPALYVYLLAFEKIMIWKVKPRDLLEGDWIISDVKVGRKIVKKSVDGLSKEDIVLLKGAGKSVFVKHGVPYMPAFLIAFLVLVFLFL